MSLVRWKFHVLDAVIDKAVANHLDLGAVVWLEAYLSTYNHILVVRLAPDVSSPSHVCLQITSHSQDFMDNVCTNIMELTFKKKVDLQFPLCARSTMTFFPSSDGILHG